jgi:hypothetical protein
MMKITMKMMMMIIMKMITIHVCSDINQTIVCTKRRIISTYNFLNKQAYQKQIALALKYKALRRVSATVCSHLQGAAVLTGIHRVIVQLDNYKCYSANMLFKEQRIVFIKLS